MGLRNKRKIQREMVEMANKESCGAFFTLQSLYENQKLQNASPTNQSFLIPTKTQYENIRQFLTPLLSTCLFVAVPIFYSIDGFY